MIDTIRFKIHVSNEDLRKMYKKGKSSVNFNQETGKPLIVFHRREFIIPSYDYHINVTIDDKEGEFFYVEYSVPKILFGHNVSLVKPNRIRESVILIKDLIEKECEISLDDYLSWNVHRLDVCYAWKFKDDDEALHVLKALSVNEYQRKKAVFRDTTTEYKGSAYDIKFYLKHPEFIKHDFKRFKRIKEMDMGLTLIEETKGVLRYEATLRKEQVEAEFGEKATIEDVEDYDEVLRVLNKYFSTFIKGFNSRFMDMYKVKRMLFDTYSNQRANNLFEFYLNYYHPDKTVRESYRIVCREEMHRSTTYRKRSFIKKAGVGIPNMGFEIDVLLSIPSNNEVMGEPLILLLAGKIDVLEALDLEGKGRR